MLKDWLLKLVGWQGYFTHINHSGTPIKWSDDIRERLAYIETKKSPAEMELRIALIRRIPDSLLPKSLGQARKKYQKAEADFLKVHQTWREAPGIFSDLTKEMVQAGDRRREAFLLLNAQERKVDWVKIHAQSCHPRCPWTPEKPDIFTNGCEIEVLGNDFLAAF